MAERVLKNPGFRYQTFTKEKWVEGELNNIFISFSPNFCYILWYFKIERTECNVLSVVAAEHWKIFKYGKKFVKNWRNALFQLAMNRFFGWSWVPIVLHFLRKKKTQKIINSYMLKFPSNSQRTKFLKKCNFAKSPKTRVKLLGMNRRITGNYYNFVQITRYVIILWFYICFCLWILFRK